jgi:beta-xylosidase
MLLMATAMPSVAQSSYKSQVWCSDNGDGTFTNPVINADYSDPDVCEANGEYYMTASSFQCIPGLPILHSKDLVNWEIIGYAIQNELEPTSEFDKPSHGNGVWAPSIRFHNGEFYIYWGDPDYGVFMVKTKDPAGTWEKPVCVIPGKGMIDTTPLWDEDGRCYLVNGWANSRAHFNSQLSVRELSKDGTKAISNPVIVFDGTRNGNFTTEGPKFYKKDGYYYIMCPAGGVEHGWQLAMRSKSPYGPYEHKTVLAQGSTKINGPHQGAWVHTPQGEDWFLHFQDRGAYGRVVWLEPVTWKSGWPAMGEKIKGVCGQPVLKYRKPKTTGNVAICNPVESDEFNEPRLGLQWQWHANYKQTYGMPTPYGFMRLFSYKLSKDYKSLWEAPNLLLQKLPAQNFTATTKVRLGARSDKQFGGIVMMGLDYSALIVQRVGNEFQLQQRTCLKADKGKAETITPIMNFKPTDKDEIDYKPAIYADIYLRMVVKDGKLNFFYSMNGKTFKPCGTEFTLREGKWIGAKMGFTCEEPMSNSSTMAQLDVDWFRVTK